MTSQQSDNGAVVGGDSPGAPERPHGELLARYGPAATGVALDGAWLDAFTIRFGHELAPADILGPRRAQAGFRQEYIYRPEVDGPLRGHAERGERSAALLVGRPLAGKSRALLNLLQSSPALRDALIFLPGPGFGRAPLEALAFPGRAGEGARCVFVFDDLDALLAVRGFERFCQGLLARRRRLVLATARPDQLHEARELLGAEVAEIVIPPLGPELRRALGRGLRRRGAVERSALVLDETIGSYFFPLSRMHEEYRLLRLQGRARLLELEILRAYKAVRLWRRQQHGRLDAIRDYVARRLARAGAPSISEGRWADALDYLGRRGFLESGQGAVGERIVVDEAYVDRIISALEEHERVAGGAPLAEEELRGREERRLARELLELYPSEATYAQLIRRVAAPELAAELYREAHGGRAALRPGSFVYNSMIARCASFAEARAVAAELEEASARPHQSTVALLMRRMRTPEQIREVIDLMMRWGIHMPEPAGIFNVAISRARSYREARELYDLCIAHGVAPTNGTFATLIARARSFDEGHEVYTLYRDSGLPPDRNFLASFYASVLRKQGGDVERALALVEELRALGLPYDGHVVRQLIDRAGSYGEAWALYRRLAGGVQRLTPTVFTGLLRHAADEAEAWAVYEELGRAGAQPSINFLNTLLGGSRTLERALAVYELIGGAGLRPDLVTFTRLIEKAGCFAEALDFFQRAMALGLLGAERPLSARERQSLEVARRELLRCLALQAREHGDYPALIGAHLAAGERLRPALFNGWLQLAADRPQALAALAEMERRGVRPGVTTLQLAAGKGVAAEELGRLRELQRAPARVEGPRAEAG
jgi:hypothetical protein